MLCEGNFLPEQSHLSRKTIGLFLFLIILVLLQQGIARATIKVDVFRAQSDLIAEKNIDPSARPTLFYTESDLALNAEKEVRRRITASKLEFSN